MRRNLAAVPVLFYPVWSHFSIAAGAPQWSLPGLVILMAVSLVLRNPRRPFSPATAVGLLGVIAVAAWDFQTATPLAFYVPPILIPAALAWLFGRSLLPGRTALISRFARQVVGDHTPATARYTRGVTWYWTIIFAALTLEALGLALFGSPEIWSLFTNLLNYLFIGAGFAAEAAYRRLRFGPSRRSREVFAHLLRTDFRALG